MTLCMAFQDMIYRQRLPVSGLAYQSLMSLFLFIGFHIELLEQPVQYRFLILNRRTPDLSKQVNAIRFWQRCILQSFIAVRTNRSQILRRIVAPLRLVDYMAHCQPHRSISTLRVGVASRDSTHLAGVSVSFKHPSASFLRDTSCESWETRDC